MSILIVDDSATSRMLLETILTKAGYEDLILAGTAQEALDYLHGAKVLPDLVLMDINMPGMDGIEATRIIKGLERFQDIQIIMVTVSDEEAYLEQAFEAGAMDFINKPVSKVELRARIRSVLRLKQEMDQRRARERELEELTCRLAEQSNLDCLTNVANRRCFNEMYPREWDRARREGRELHVLMIDIDHFKLYNDTYGHLKGDECLAKVAEAIAKALKRPADFMARYGGEEFVVVLPDTDAKGAENIAREIQANLAALALEHVSSTVADTVTVSIGIAGAKPNGKGAEQLLNISDKALYEAKTAGRNTIRISKDRL